MTLERCKICPTKDRYATFELAEAAALRKTEKYGTPHRSYLCNVPGPGRESPCGGFHHTTEQLPPVAETSSAKYKRTNWENITRIIPAAARTGRRGRARGTSSAMVNARRERVRNAVFGNPNTNYKDIAGSLGIPYDMFMSDVRNLQGLGILPYRNGSDSRVATIAAAPVTGRAPVLTAAQKIEVLKKQLAAAEQEDAMEEAARIERERVHVDWIVNNDLSKEIRARKHTTTFSASVEVWRELLSAVFAQIEKYDRNEISFPALENAVAGTIVSGPNAGLIHPDFRRQ